MVDFVVEAEDLCAEVFSSAVNPGVLVVFTFVVEAVDVVAEVVGVVIAGVTVLLYLLSTQWMLSDQWLVQ